MIESSSLLKDMQTQSKVAQSHFVSERFYPKLWAYQKNPFVTVIQFKEVALKFFNLHAEIEFLRNLRINFSAAGPTTLMFATNLCRTFTFAELCIFSFDVSRAIWAIEHTQETFYWQLLYVVLHSLPKVLHRFSLCFNLKIQNSFLLSNTTWISDWKGGGKRRGNKE